MAYLSTVISEWKQRHVWPRRLTRALSFCICLVLLLSAVLPPKKAEADAYTKESNMFFDAFDTVISLSGYVTDRKIFDQLFADVRNLFVHYHRVFDNYNEYEDLANLCYMNAHASEGYVKVEPELTELLLWLKQNQPIGKGRVNVALGAVLSIWHAHRTEGISVPDMESLCLANEHTSFDDILIDAENSSVFFADPLIQVDLGAIAKGYTVEIAAKYLDQSEMPSYIINAGGNVRCGASPEDGRTYWGVGIQDPINTNNNLDVIYLKNASVVTSGDYQRYYTVDGVRYHHIIDPDTLMPSAYMHSVTVVTMDSGLADLLSTALFNLSYEDGRALVDSLDGVEAYWYLNDGAIRATDGLAPMLSSNGAKSRN